MKKYRGYEYLVLQMPMGHLCGYVKLPKDHPYYGKHYDDMDIDCHGGLTHAREYVGNEDHITRRFFSKGYWVGFDYAHCDDWQFYSHSISNEGNTLTQPFEVEEECKRVINQLLEIQSST